MDTVLISQRTRFLCFSVLAEFLYVQDENLVTYGTVDLMLPPITGAKCLVLYYRLFQSPIMALYIMKRRDNVETTAYSVVSKETLINLI